MKDRLGIVLLSAVMIFALTGCGNEIVDLTDNQSEQISEYAAAVLLAYDKDYHSRLLNDEEIAQAEAAEAEEQARAEEAEKIAQAMMDDKKPDQEDKDVSDKDDANGEEEMKPVVISEFLGLNGMDVQYAGCSVEDYYPAQSNSIDGQAEEVNTFFSMKASEGNKLLVLKFNMQNISGQDQNVDMLSKQLRFSVQSDTFGKKNTLVTMLEDDFSTYTGTIASGNSAQSVLIVEITEEQAVNVGQLSLQIKYNDESASVQLQ